MKRIEGDFDYIVVGAGTAGCIVANRLSTNPKTRVLILEAGGNDHWRQLGLAGWAYSDVLPHFKRLEDHFLGESEHHGTGGGWRIEAPRLSWDILDAVGAAAEQMGIVKIPDFNTGDNEGVGYFHVNQKRGRRGVFARGFLNPTLR